MEKNQRAYAEGTPNVERSMATPEVCVCMYVYGICVCVCVCTHIASMCIYIYICIYINIYIYIWRKINVRMQKGLRI